MIIGISGTRKGLTEAQSISIIQYLTSLRSQHEYLELHHGDCIGADENVHIVCIENKLVNKIIIHPPTNSSLRAYTENITANDITIEVTEDKDYLERNKDIVNMATIIIVCPKNADEELRSGTWSVYRTAKKQNKTIGLITPDGKIEMWPNDEMARKLLKKLHKNKTKN